MSQLMMVPDLSALPMTAVLSTEDAAAALGRSGSTLRRLYAQCGSVYGIRPLKIGGRLAWKVSDLRRLVEA